MRLRLLQHAAGFSGISASDVHFVRNWFEVFWVDARRDSANVVEVRSLWDWTDQKLVRESMRPDQAQAVPEHSVPEWGVGSSPQPAFRGLLDFRPESLFRRLRRAYEFACAGVMFHAVFITQER
jgi:hypothetical protein